MNIEQLERSLERKTSVNLNRVAKEHFTPEFLEVEADRLLNLASYSSRMATDLGMPVLYNPTELEKCVVHYSARRLIGDLWSFSLPRIKPHVTDNGRFNLDKAQADGKIGNLSTDIGDNLEAGFEYV